LSYGAGTAARLAAGLLVACLFILTSVVAAIGMAMALWGCAICENDPPSYFGAGLIATIAMGILWVLWRFGRGLFAVGSYQREQ